jgi:hypothetical protein
MSEMELKAMARLLERLNDPSHQYPAHVAAALHVEFRSIEREWKQALEPATLQSALKRLGAEIERQEGALADEAATTFAAGREAAHLIGKSARLMTIRYVIEQENP